MTDIQAGEIDQERLRAIAASTRSLTPPECAERARQAAALIGPAWPGDAGPGTAVLRLLWRDQHSEAWINLARQPRDTGYHDHDGSGVGVHVIAGRAWSEPLTIGTPPRPRRYAAGDTFWVPAQGIHRMDHEPGAITIHVYSPPIRSIGHYDLDGDELRRIAGAPDMPSPPSSALLRARYPKPVG